MEAIGKAHKVSIPDEAVTYLALALRHRVTGLLENMNTASKHRWASVGGTGSGSVVAPSNPTLYDDGKTPIFERTVRKDVGKQLQAMEKLEKEGELRLRRERKDRQEALRQALGGGGAPATATASTPGAGGGGAGGGAGDDEEPEGPPKKKKKKADGPGVTAKNMSEDMKKRLANNAANQAAGFGNRYAWMNASAAAGGGVWQRRFVEQGQEGRRGDESGCEWGRRGQSPACY